jgi:hypothetical protein
MKRLSVIVLVVSVLALVWAAGAGASPTRGPRHRQLVPGAPTTPSVRTGAEKFALTGSLLDFDGSPLAGGWVEWGWYDPDGYSWYCPDAVMHDGADDTTGRDGSFSFADVTSLPAHDTLMVGGSSSPGLLYAVLYHLDFSTKSDYVIRPGHVGVSVTNAPAGRQAQVGLGDALYVAAQSSVDLTGGAGAADAMAPDFNSARVSFPNANGSVTAECDWLSPGLAPVPVSPGAVCDTVVHVDWGAAVHGRIAGPLCRHSGRPGSTVKYTVSNLPAGEQLSFVGYSWVSDWDVQKYPEVVTSSGAGDVYTVALRIPKRATPGTVYDVDAERTDQIQSMLWLYDYYEVCDFSATHRSIRRGDGVRLRGHIDAKAATLFVRHSAAPQPASVKARGWTKVGSLSVNARGHFLSPVLRPSRSTWYVVRYRGLNGGFTAFTPVVQVTVR